MSLLRHGLNFESIRDPVRALSRSLCSGCLAPHPDKKVLAIRPYSKEHTLKLRFEWELRN
jgi:hypothetical protein